MLVRPGISKIGEDSVAHVLGHEAAESIHGFGNTLVIHPDHSKGPLARFCVSPAGYSRNNPVT